MVYDFAYTSNVCDGRCFLDRSLSTDFSEIMQMSLAIVETCKSTPTTMKLVRKCMCLCVCLTVTKYLCVITLWILNAHRFHPASVAGAAVDFIMYVQRWVCLARSLRKPVSMPFIICKIIFYFQRKSLITDCYLGMELIPPMNYLKGLRYSQAKLTKILCNLISSTYH